MSKHFNTEVDMITVILISVILVSLSCGQPLIKAGDLSTENRNLLTMVDSIKEWQIRTYENQNEIVNMMNKCSQKMEDVMEQGNEKFSQSYKMAIDYFANISSNVIDQNVLFGNIYNVLQLQTEKINNIENQYANYTTMMENITLTLTEFTEIYRNQCSTNISNDRPCPGKVKTKAEECQQHNGYTYFSAGDLAVCLKFVHGIPSLNVTKFEAACVQDGGNLIKIDSSKKHQLIKDYFATLPSFGDPQIIIQGNDIGVDGIWKFDDGTKMTYLPWDSQQPNSAGGDQDYIGMKKSYSNYKWGDIWKYRVGMSSAYICEIDL